MGSLGKTVYVELMELSSANQDSLRRTDGAIQYKSRQFSYVFLQ